MKIFNPQTFLLLHRVITGKQVIHRFARLLVIAPLLFFLLFSTITVKAQTPVPKDVRAKLLKLYQGMQKPEISFERFLADNTHVYTSPKTAAREDAAAAAVLAPQDTYCAKVSPYCANGDFETGLDQTQYTGAYGTWSAAGNANLYPDPFSLTYGFLSGVISASTAHQTIVNKGSGNDAITNFPVVPSNGGNQSLRLGNTAVSYGTEILAKTVIVDPSETILNFYYAVVFQDPGHPIADQPAFSVRAYDCATGLELPNVCNLGNGGNTAVSNAANPFFKSLNSASFGIIAYRDWSAAQIDLSAYVGKKVVIIFTNKDCGQGGHWGYTYLDNLFSSQCPVVQPGTPTQGSVKLDPARRDSCGSGQVCTKYVLPFVVNNNITTTGDVTISMNIYQNNALVKTLTSPKLATYNADSSYCFSIDPSTLGINTALGGFDYSVTGQFTLSGFTLSPITIGNPPQGQKAGVNNDYLVLCASGCNMKVTGASANATDNNADGSVTLTATGGTAPYTYTLNAVSNNTGMFPGLMAGTYSYTVSDNGTCKSSGSITVGKTVPGGGTAACPPDSTITITSGNCTTVLNWNVPSLPYPDSIPIVAGTSLPNGWLLFKGIYNGHGYYQSNDDYSWPNAKAAAAAVNGHLVTIGDVGESNFIKANLPQPDFGAWIGLYNTGTVGSFAWVTGEPFTYADWNFAEPNNENGSATFVNEPYVHIRGAAPNDRWNDASALWNLAFMAEYENPVLTYTQTSGPAPGTTVGTGVYTICYEIINHATGAKTTCCFKITVVCNGASACLKDTVINAVAPNCNTIVKWSLPSVFPDSIAIGGGISKANGWLFFKGQYNGHGYYQSDDAYSWPDAKTMAMSVNGHLVTITDAGESNFIKANLPQPDFGAWIGLYNTGTVGSFAWVNGEPFAYSDWNYLEPNNQNGTPTTIAEPYVHIRGAAPNDRWNDASPAWNLNFIAEYDQPILTYTQISGIPWGSTQAPGVYPICYEIFNQATGKKYTCCFNVTVVCNQAVRMAATQSANRSAVTATPAAVATITGLSVTAYPNPGHGSLPFSIRTQSNASEKITIKVFDMMGRLVDAKAGVQPNSTTTMGSSYRPGMYLMQVVQGGKTLSLKLMKQ